MHYSINEIEQTCRKAARGWGLPWGVADEVSRAMASLHRHGINGCMIFSEFLNDYQHATDDGDKVTYQAGRWQAKNKIISPIFLGLSMNDYIESVAQSQAHQVAYPALLIGFLLSKSATHHYTIDVRWDGVVVEIARNTLSITSDEAKFEKALTEKLSISVISDCADNAQQKMPKTNNSRHCLYDVSDEVWQTIQYYAHRTYVEATEQSREMGAGAGLVDDD